MPTLWDTSVHAAAPCHPTPPACPPPVGPVAVSNHLQHPAAGACCSHRYSAHFGCPCRPCHSCCRFWHSQCRGRRTWAALRLCPGAELHLLPRLDPHRIEGVRVTLGGFTATSWASRSRRAGVLASRQCFCCCAFPVTFCCIGTLE
jgi:hypothetical protein